MRLFLVTDASTHILMAPSDISFDDFKKACQTKCGIEEARIELDVEGAPAVSDISEVRDGDRLKVKRPSEDEGKGKTCPSKRRKTVISDDEESDEESDEEDGEEEDSEEESEEEDGEEESDEEDGEEEDSESQIVNGSFSEKFVRAQ